MLEGGLQEPPRDLFAVAQRTEGVGEEAEVGLGEKTGTGHGGRHLALESSTGSGSGSGSGAGSGADMVGGTTAVPAKQVTGGHSRHLL
ncbi:hypothetical protein SLA_5145 [Streptomyces laurentii]|uniref:Uncharacterized protein n=1 Tax=Streptomyces laurentii TaxID=39478 RepID=A0A160P372_STRLU|nr:hypothetical protein SLA_5145 [Streptomyces laurentii]